MERLISTLAQAMDIERRKFTRGEQKFIIDILNGTFLTPALLGQHLIPDVEDSFSDLPGEYESKWGIKQEEIFPKIHALNPLQTALVELWAVAFWAGDNPDLDDYVTGRDNIAIRLESITNELIGVSKTLDKTKSSFKSAAIANARAGIDRVVEQLQ